MSLCIYLFLLIFSACAKQPVYPEPPRIGSEIVIDVKGLQSGTPEFFTYRHGGKKISFFIIATEGKVLSFLDACMSCYPSKRGYRFDNGHVICRECGVSLNISEIEKGIGGCFPIRLSGHLEGRKYLIPVSELEEHGNKF